MTTRNPRTWTGFTLTELLVVIAIIGLLAALALAGTAAAKRKANQAVCRSNLKQLGVFLGQFVMDRGEYPLFLNTELTNKYPDHALTWMGTLQQEAGVHLQPNEGVLKCPSARRPGDLPPNQAYVSYGYNSDGVIGYNADRPLGLGGSGLENGAVFPPPVRAAEVVKPEEMISLGDSFFGWPSYVVDGRYFEIGLRSGLAALPGETTRALRRHDKQGNYTFCDAHVDGIALEKLYLKPIENLARYWNRDNKPHPERFQ